MGFKLKHSHLNNGLFTQALRKIAHTRDLPVKTAYTIGKLDAWMQKETQSAREEYVKVLKQFAELDEKGEIKAVEGEGPGSYKIPTDKMEDFEKAVKEFMDIELEVPYNKIPMDVLSKAGLTPAELVALEPILITLEAVTQDEAV